MLKSQTLGVVYWNTWYRASSGEQLNHMQELDDQIRCLGADAVVWCLSEATMQHDGQGLADKLEFSEGYNTVFRTTDTLHNGSVTEGLCVASRDLDVLTTTFQEVRQQRGVRSIKHRWLASLVVPIANNENLEIRVAHFSYPFPSNDEVAAVGECRMDKKIFGGDLNTLIKRRHVLKMFCEKGWIKLIDPDHKTTVPVHRSLEQGWELDHVFVSPDLVEQSELKIGEQGPSNHRPLLVTTKL